MLGFPFLEVLILFEQWAGHRSLSEKVTRPHVRAISIPSMPVSDGIELRHMGVSSLVVWLRLWPYSLVVWAGSCHVELALTCPGYAIWGGINVLMVFLPDHWNLVTINALVLGYPKGSAAELLDGSLKLRY